MIIKFMLNNMKKNLDADPDDKLSDVLRDDFGLLSVNSCCNTGRCGGCTVLKDNIPVPACMVKMFSVRNSNILTYEYISTTKEFETITKVLDAMGCNFCNFCKHGKMIRAELAAIAETTTKICSTMGGSDSRSACSQRRY